MKLERTKISDKMVKRVSKEKPDYINGFYAGYVQGRDGQLKADRKATQQHST